MKRRNRVKFLGDSNKPQLDYLVGKQGVITEVLPDDEYYILFDSGLYLGLMKIRGINLEKISAQ